MFLAANHFMLIRIREDSMAPTLVDGQWVIVLRGRDAVRKGDVVLFSNPEDKELTVKRFVLTSNETPQIEHGWLVTPWGKWFLTPKEWQRLMDTASTSVSDAFFLLGDNQFYSLDSRTYGYVDKTWIIGRILSWRRL